MIRSQPPIADQSRESSSHIAPWDPAQDGEATCSGATPCSTTPGVPLNARGFVTDYRTAQLDHFPGVITVAVHEVDGRFDKGLLQRLSLLLSVDVCCALRGVLLCTSCTCRTLLTWSSPSCTSLSAITGSWRRATGRCTRLCCSVSSSPDPDILGSGAKPHQGVHNYYELNQDLQRRGLVSHHVWSSDSPSLPKNKSQPVAWSPGSRTAGSQGHAQQPGSAGTGSEHGGVSSTPLY